MVSTLPWYDYKVTQGYTVGKGGNHDGLDLATPTGTPLTTLWGGQVTPHTGWYPWGGEVDIKLPNGLTETFAHVDAIGVRPGDYVQAGQVVALSGGEHLPAQYSSGPHTHFSLFGGNPWDNSKSVDPTGNVESISETFPNSGLRAPTFGPHAAAYTASLVPNFGQSTQGNQQGLIQLAQATQGQSNVIASAVNFANQRISQAATRTAILIVGILLLGVAFYLLAKPAIDRGVAGARAQAGKAAKIAAVAA